MAIPFIKAINSSIRSNKALDYICSTHFWGPVSNFGLPIAAILDTQKSPDIISPQFTGTMIVYSSTFMRYAMAIRPQNYLLFLCHFTNVGAQMTQGYRFLQHQNVDRPSLLE
ncbi:UPF0041-domain-containing protein [Penicillium brevicompactum]|uniref:UPF0041-domain-containing protein n=1 Tax=Penicillium brevicompactum TaxID=5074 RepID=UPI002542637D|nr:UPF0041-domain-containing protein [Penicillium brevicompactum]KAJ5326280.1 UPF0041-domain-containing protein [Penicillium brevicompactum]